MPGVRGVIAASLLALAVQAAAATAAPGLFVGVTDDAFLWRGAAAVGAANELGLAAVRVTVPWAAGRSTLSPADIDRLDNAVPAASAGLRLVVTVLGKAVAAPQDDLARDAYCEYVRDLLAHYPLINDIVIWNEPNLGFYWQPQFTPEGTSAAPAGYERLLARCWDVLHAFRPNVNVIMTTSPSGNDDPAAASNVSHSPGTFIRKLGAAYKASGRASPIFDTVGHNPYGMSSAESPSRQHLTPSHIGEADEDRLVAALDAGFAGTAQPLPGRCTKAGLSCLSIWYLETGYQTIPTPAHWAAYTGRENDAQAVSDVSTNDPAPTQSAQLTNGIKLAYCQPYVTGIFNFLLWDEPDLARWQSGVFWADGAAKTSFDALQRVITKVNMRNVDCGNGLTSHLSPGRMRSDPLIDRIDWPQTTVYSTFNEVWGFMVVAHTAVSYHAALRHVRTCTPSSGAVCGLTTRGTLKGDRPLALQFPERRLVRGSYRIEITLTRRRPRLAVTRRSPAFLVG